MIHYPSARCSAPGEQRRNGHGSTKRRQRASYARCRDAGRFRVASRRTRCGDGADARCRRACRVCARRFAGDRGNRAFLAHGRGRTGPANVYLSCTKPRAVLAPGVHGIRRSRHGSQAQARYPRVSRMLARFFGRSAWGNPWHNGRSGASIHRVRGGVAGRTRRGGGCRGDRYRLRVLTGGGRWRAPTVVLGHVGCGAGVSCGAASR